MKLWVTYLKKFSFLIPLLILSILFYFITPQQLVEYVGVSNAYVFMFLIALLGGVSMFSGVPYPAILVAFGLGGLDPFLLGFSAAFGLFIGDSTSFFVGKKSGELLHGYVRKVLDRLLVMYEKYPKYLPVAFFVYGALAPFPNDVVTVSAGMRGYSYTKTMIPLALGNLFFCTAVAYAADFFSGIF